MGDWWDGLTGDLQVFYLIGVIAGVFLILQLLFLGFGVGSDLDIDLEDEGAGTGFLSLRSLTAFFFTFGWTGVLMKEADSSTAVSVIVAIAVGLAVFFAVAFMWRKFSQMEESGSIDYQSAVGVIGTVYLPIPANRSMPGKVELLIQGRLRVIDAYTSSDSDLPAQTRVTVVSVVDQSTVLVKPL